MADIFGSQQLFAEFDKAADRPDRILMSKLKDEVISAKNVSDKEQTDETTFVDGNPDDELTSKALDPETETETSEINKLLKSHKSGGGGDNSDLETLVTKLQAELTKVCAERDRLQKINRIVNTTKFVSDTDGPAVQVLYMNSGFSSKYKPAVENFFGNLLLDRSTLNDSAAEYRITPSSICVSDETSIDKEAQRRRVKSTVIGSSQFYLDFVIDVLGWPLQGDNPAMNESWEIPIYAQVYFSALPLDPDQEGPSKQEKRSKSACFNCGEPHTLRECKMAHNQARIAENRRKFQSSMPKKSSQNSYRIEDDPRFSKFKPGEISDNLREAMGLSRHALPPYIYQMRVLGYPPGYTELLMEQASGLAMFDKHGNEVSTDGNTTEEGETDVSRDVVDTKEIICYPGFNVEAGQDSVDEGHKMGFPPMSRSQSRETMIKMFSQRKGVKRAHSNTSQGEERQSKRSRWEHRTASDMDMSEDSSPARRPLKRGDTEILPPSSPAPETTDTDSVTLEELEIQKQLIQSQLEESEGTDTDVQIKDSYSSQDEGTDSFLPPLPPTPVRPPLPIGTPPQTPEGPPRLLQTPSSGGSRSIALGTPVSEATGEQSRSKCLPQAHKFSDGIAQHIPFENLPGATGTFEKMRGVLDQIRKRKENSS